jgi:protein-disulfide isomerase
MVTKRANPVKEKNTFTVQKVNILHAIKSSSKKSANIYLIATLLIFAFLLGMLVNKVQSLENNLNTQSLAANNNAPDSAQAPDAYPTEDLSPKKVSTDDDPVIGDENAKVTMIDFTDYECPFCKKYFDETYGQIKKEYIDTGKVKYVIRDLPLSFHQNAHKQAQAAECAREQGGDEVYVKYHDEIFKRTTSNGTGLALDKLAIIANDLGLNGEALQSCLDSDTYKTEVDKDIADASKVGATGTPSFFIGKSSDDGTITGTPLIGAQPYNAFKTIIDQELN